jgi:hypothetical protein
MQRFSTAVMLLGMVVATAVAQAPPETIKLQIRPAAESSPALKYQLLPPADQLAPGNAVQVYYRAFSPEWFTRVRRPEVYGKIENSLETSAKELPRKDLDFLLASPQLREVDLGARRESCDWDLLRRLRVDGVGLLLPDIQSFRQFATLLACRARLQIADRNYAGAIHTFQTGMAMSRHLGESPLLISSIVGVASAMVTLRQVEELIQSPDSPNLYWALTELPIPLIDIRKPLQGEQLTLLAEMPLLHDLESGPLGPEQQKALRKQYHHLLHLFDSGADRGTQGQMLALGFVIKQYSEARKALIRQGKKPEEIEAWPALQIALIHSLHEYERLRDDLHKWAALPYWQARPGLEQAVDSIKKAKANMEGIPFVDFLPALEKVFGTVARLDRRIAALRCVEAIRLYAAAHGGRLPGQLADIKEVPIPIDPTMGTPFVYQVLEGDKVLLTAAAPPGHEKDPGSSLRYELTMKHN